MENDNVITIQDKPSNQLNEQQILASIILNEKVMLELVDVIDSSMFCDEFNRKIFISMLYLHHNSRSINYKTIIERLQYKEKDNDDIIEYVLQLTNSILSNEPLENLVDILKDNYQKRVLWEWALKRITTPMSGIASSNLVKEIEEKIDGMGITSNIEYTNFNNYVDEWLEYQEDETPVQSHKLGFKKLDEIILLENSNLMLIGARPSVGKSAFATNLVKNFCLYGKHPLFISLEMNKKEFMNRLVSNMAHIQARKLKRKEKKTPEEWSKIMQVKDTISDFQFKFYDKGGMTIEQLYGLARYLKKKNELDVIVIDYLQLLETHQYKGQKQNQVSFISQKLKQLAMELDIPVIALAQLNRGVVTQSGEPREPQLSDLRDSGSLEQDANIVLMLHTEDINQEFGNEDSANGRFIELFVRKNRDGKLGTVKYDYFGDYVEFREKEWDKDRSCYVDVIQDEIKPVIEIDEEDLPF